MKICSKWMIVSSQRMRMNEVTVERIAHPDLPHIPTSQSSFVAWTPIVVVPLDLLLARVIPWPNLDHNLLYMEQSILPCDLNAPCAP